MAAKVAVVVPHHKEELNIFEQISLAQLQKVLGHYPIIFAVPEGANFSWIPAGRQVIQFPYLGRGVQYYNILFMSTILYSQFLEYDYILIYQLDAFVFSDKLEYFCSLGYDNIGGPWTNASIYAWHINKLLAKDEPLPVVGNGGFCLRNPRACIKIVDAYANWWREYVRHNEDVFFAYFGVKKGSGFRAAPLNIARQFAFESLPQHFIHRNNGELPFGCHAYFKCSKEFYIKAIANCGYDLSSVSSQMSNGDIDSLRKWATQFAANRLLRRLQKGLSILRYLPQNRYASIRAIRHPLTMLILARLLLENNNLSDEIYFYDESELDILIHDCQPEKLPHLLITTGGGTDINLTNALEKSGLAYGKRVVSFQREYMAYCENLFHNLGK